MEKARPEDLVRLAALLCPSIIASRLWRFMEQRRWGIVELAAYLDTPRQQLLMLATYPLPRSNADFWRLSTAIPADQQRLAEVLSAPTAVR